ncbi:MAG: HDOD domain-containing protein [Burkholderiales bacterium]|nr:HDOD domain-containing protein [Burkholderiales bacterium]
MGTPLKESAGSIDRFLLRKVLGEGGQGIVYLAHDPKLNRDVAIKALNVSDGDQMQALLHEARAVGALRHPCIVPVFEAGEYLGTPYLVFEYATGETLEALIKRGGALPVADALKIAAQVLDGLAHAHTNGVLHRDIKPSNIMLGNDGTPRIMDFGAASRNQLNWLNGVNTGVDEEFIGTPTYMAPEYIEKKVFSARTDIYAAGLVVCEMLTGQRVFKGGAGGLDALFNRIMNDPIVLPPGSGMNEKIVACLLRALDRDPEARYGSVLEMKEALLQANAAESVEPAAQAGQGTVEFLLRRIRLKKEFPAMAESITNVNNIVSSGKGGVTSLTNAVLRDFALTNKVIKLANSAYYNPSSSGKVSTVSGAIYRLGFDTIRNTVLGLLLFEHLKDRGQATDLMRECTQAILGGAIAKEICVVLGGGNPEETFICAMMHNLGRMLSIYYFQEETAEICKILALGKVNEEQASRKVLGAGYTELGQGVAKSWAFPQKIIGSMDKRLPAGGARTHASADESMRLIVCMASDLSAVALTEGDPGELKKCTRQTVEKYQRHLKLKHDAVDGIFSRALAKFNEYTAAVGWKLDQSLARRFGALHEAAAEAVDADPDTETLAESGQLDDFEKTIRVDPRAAKALLSEQASKQAQARRDVLSGGIQDVANAMVEGRRLNEILRVIVEAIGTGIGFDHVIFALHDLKNATMQGRFGLGQGIDALVKSFSFPLAFAPDVFHMALRQGIDIFVTDADDAKFAPRIPNWHRTKFAAGTFVLFPIVVNGKPLGMIYADAAQANSIVINEAELKLLRTLRSHAVLAIRQPT